MELKINQKFKDLLNLPSESERKELERQLVRDGGPRDPITVWKGKDIIVDGHNRYGICQAHSLKFDVRYIEFKDDSEVEDWILENQLGRRNLSPARASYFIGLLYNRTKQKEDEFKTSLGGKTTSETIAEKFGVSEKTVRRSGEEAKGIDAVGRVKKLASVTEKINAIKDKNEGFTKGELQEIGKAKSPTIAEKAVSTLLEQKKKAAEVKAKVNATAKKTEAPKKTVTKETYPVVFAKPNFERTNFSVDTEARPPMADNCMVYMSVPDEELAQGMALLKKWGLKYEASFVFKADRYEGMWSDITHTFLLAASRGDGLAAPKKMVQSLNAANGPVEEAMLKLVQQYHASAKLLDMSKTK